MVWRFVIGYVLLAAATTLFMWCCIEVSGPDAPEDIHADDPALLAWLPRTTAGDRSENAESLSAVCALSASVARVGDHRPAATSDFPRVRRE